MKHTRMHQLVATLAIAGAVTAGTAGIAVAADGGSGGSAGGDAAATASVGHRGRGVRALGQAVAETLGVSRAELRAALKGGQSIEEYATSLGQDPSAVAASLQAKADARIDQAVANGRISAERGETAKAKVAERLPTLMARHFGQGA